MINPHPDTIHRSATAGADGKGKVTLLLSRCDQSIGSDTEQALSLARSALHLATLRNDRRSIAECHRRIARCMSRDGHHQTALSHLHKAAAIFQELEEWREGNAVTVELGNIHEAMGDHAQALAAYRQSREECEDRGERRQLAAALEAIGGLYSKLGDYRKALEHYFRSLEIHEAEGPTDAVAMTRSNIGVIYGMLGEYEKALDFFTVSLELFRSEGNRYLEVRALSNIGGAYYSLDRLDLALEHAFKSLAIHDELGDRDEIPGTLMRIGNIYERLGQFDVALGYQFKALAAVQERGTGSLQLSLFLSIANLYLKGGLHSNAIGICQQALVLAEDIADRRLQYQLHEVLSRAFEAFGDAVSALDHYRRYSQIRDELQGQEKQRDIAEMQFRFDVERTEKEKEIYRLKAERLEAEVEHKTKELTAMALNLIQKNELLGELKERVERVVHATSSEAKRVARTVLEQIEESRHSDESWKVFEQQLGQLHGDFIRVLSERYPCLATMELRICSLLRLGLTTKEIADLMCISTRTVENHRYRIRKKLTLPSVRTLGSFLASL
jgi:tetratricopeptide (TPR) repeat protein/DNA-binding CsgD family transcriptional regulator